MQANDETRGHLHAMWSAVAPAWGEHAHVIDTLAGTLTEHMLDVTHTGANDRVLELACGAGGLGLAAAQRAGEVVLSDVAPEMVEIAGARAAALGATNVQTRVLDIEEIDEPDASYDVVLCREGLMFAVDPVRAFREIHRVLRPGGRLAAAVWGPRAENPWLGALMDAVSEQIGMPIPPPGIPGPFALDDADRLRGLAAEAGLDGATVESLPIPRHLASFDEWWERTSALAGPLSKILENLPPEAVDAIRERARETLAPTAHRRASTCRPCPSSSATPRTERSVRW